MWKGISGKKGLLTISLFTSAIILMGYPYIANYIFEHRTDSIVETTEKLERNMEDRKREEYADEINKYNQELYSGRIQLQDPFKETFEEKETGKYNELLNINKNGIMGTIVIPAINIKLPIYHGTSEKILEKGIGHLEGSSLPLAFFTSLLLSSLYSSNLARLNSCLITIQVSLQYFNFLFISLPRIHQEHK